MTLGRCASWMHPTNEELRNLPQCCRLSFEVWKMFTDLVGCDGTVRSLMMRFISARGTYECVPVCDQVAMSRENDLYFSIVTSLSRRVVAAVDSLHFNSFLISQRARREFFPLVSIFFPTNSWEWKSARREISTRFSAMMLRATTSIRDDPPIHTERGRENNRRFFFFLLTLRWSMQEFFSTSHFLAFRKGKKILLNFYFIS